jgi:predicted  nucleic acid-binding Zn-ribbon protein
LNQVEDNWKVDSRNVDREDVTDSYNQLETEIESLKTEHQRLKELINQTDDVENLIRLQERMSQVRSQINYKQERLDRMDENIEYSKVHITLEGPQSFESKFELRETLSDAYSALFDSVKLIIVGTAYLLPVAAIYGIYRIGIRVKRERL